RTEAHHATYIIASQMYQHDVLGQLLGVFGQFRLETLVLSGRGTAPTRSGNRPRGDHAVAQAHHRLGRRSHHGALLAAHKVEVRAGIDEAKDAIKVERIRLEIDIEALRKHHL